MRVTVLILIFVLISGCTESSDLEVTEKALVIPSTPDSTEGINKTRIEGGVGSVVGYLLSSINQSPIVGVGIYLGEILPLDPGPDYLITLKENESPHTRTDENGYFEISNVLPGEYPIIVWTPVRSQVVADVIGELELMVNIEAGRMTDLGIIEVDWR